MADIILREPVAGPRRPLGVWIFAVLQILGSLITLIGTAILLLAVLAGCSFPGLTLDYLGHVVHSFVMLFIAIGVWLGHNPSRVSLLNVSTLYYAASIGLSFYDASTGAVNIDNALARGLWALFFMLLFLWYFR